MGISVGRDVFACLRYGLKILSPVENVRTSVDTPATLSLSLRPFRHILPVSSITKSCTRFFGKYLYF